MRVYLDSMVWIYTLEGNPHFGSLARGLLQNLRSGNHVLLVSEFLLGEVLVLPVRKSNTFLVASYRILMLPSAIVEVVPFSNQVGLNFASLRALHRTTPADSIHLALAASANADFFITGDERLNRLTIPGIGQIAGLNVNIPWQ